jgi:5'-AMP-activated protein kinase regulatory gamma subunit
MAPILSCDPGGLEVPNVLHTATLGGVLTCLMRHFRASLASLPLLAQPLCSLALGTWSEEAAGAADHIAYHQLLLQRQQSGGGGGSSGGMGSSSGGGGPPLLINGHGDSKASGSIVGKDGGTVHIRPLQLVHPSTPLTTALGMLLEAGVSALPVVDERGSLLDVYARADITHLCRGNAYNRLQWEDVTVGQALSLSQPGPSSWSSQAPAAAPPGLPTGVDPGPRGLSGLSAAGLDAAVRGGSVPGGAKPGRVAVVARDEPLRTVVERLSAPGVRRLVVVQRGTGRVEGVVSLSDVAALLFAM